MLAGCSAQLRASAGLDVPPYSESYSTEAGSDGVRGGATASDAQGLLEQQLKARGDEAEPDRALAATAAWALQSAYAKRDVSDTKLVTTTAQRFGFAGLVLGFVAGPLAEERVRLQSASARRTSCRRAASTNSNSSEPNPIKSPIASRSVAPGSSFLRLWKVA